jgi:hypothetical protein
MRVWDKLENFEDLRTPPKQSLIKEVMDSLMHDQKWSHTFKRGKDYHDFYGVARAFLETYHHLVVDIQNTGGVKLCIYPDINQSVAVEMREFVGCTFPRSQLAKEFGINFFEKDGQQRWERLWNYIQYDTPMNIDMIEIDNVTYVYVGHDDDSMSERLSNLKNSLRRCLDRCSRNPQIEEYKATRYGLGEKVRRSTGTIYKCMKAHSSPTFIEEFWGQTLCTVE